MNPVRSSRIISTFDFLQLRNRRNGMCLDSLGSAYDKRMNIVLRSCDSLNVKVHSQYSFCHLVLLVCWTSSSPPYFRLILICTAVFDNQTTLNFIRSKPFSLYDEILTSDVETTSMSLVAVSSMIRLKWNFKKYIYFNYCFIVLTTLT